MYGQQSQLLRLGVGGLDIGPGISGPKAWIVAFVVLLVLAWLARWSMRPPRRAARTKQSDDSHETNLAKPTVEHGDADMTLPKQTRKAR